MEENINLEEKLFTNQKEPDKQSQDTPQQPQHTPVAQPFHP
jgi:hypothetical protein